MKKINFIFLVSIMFLCAAHIFATAQYPDKIIYQGKVHKLHTNPMEAYFEKFPDKRPNSEMKSSALWRGYVATFEVTDNELWLKDIEIQTQIKGGKPFDLEWSSVLGEIFPQNQKIKIDWYSGLLIIPFGNIVQYVHMGYSSTFENYILLEIEKGDFKRAKEFNHKEYAEFREKQFEAFKKTEEYEKLVDQMSKKQNHTPEYIDTLLKNFIINYSSKILVD